MKNNDEKYIAFFKKICIAMFTTILQNLKLKTQLAYGETKKTNCIMG